MAAIETCESQEPRLAADDLLLELARLAADATGQVVEVHLPDSWIRVLIWPASTGTPC